MVPLVFRISRVRLFPGRQNQILSVLYIPIFMPLCIYINIYYLSAGKVQQQTKTKKTRVTWGLMRALQWVVKWGQLSTEALPTNTQKLNERGQRDSEQLVPLKKHKNKAILMLHSTVHHFYTSVTTSMSKAFFFSPRNFTLKAFSSWGGGVSPNCLMIKGTFNM